MTAPSCIGGPLYLSDGLKTDRPWFRSKDNANKVRLRLKASKQAYGFILFYNVLLDRVLNCCSCYSLFVQCYVTASSFCRRKDVHAGIASCSLKCTNTWLTNAILHSIIAELLHVDHTTFIADIRSAS